MLEGVLVLDLADMQGSFCSKLLADLGATVIKIEPPEGESARNLPSFFYNNANKLGIALDTETGKGKQLLRRLLLRSDILVETSSSNCKAIAGMDAEQIRRINPSLVHLSMTGFGRTGPKRHFRSGDAVVSAFGGQMYVTGAPGGKPSSLFFHQSFYTASLFGANAVLLGLRKRRVTGKGSYIDLSVQEAVASALDPIMIDYFCYGRIARRQTDHPGQFFAILPCKDGFIQITISQNWETLLELLQAEGKAADLPEPKWRETAFREKRRAYIFNVLANWTKTHTRNELFKLGQAMQFPWAPVEPPHAVIQSRQLRSRRFFSTVSIPESSQKFSIPGRPFKLDGVAPIPSKPAPSLGEHAHEVLESLKAGSRKHSLLPAGDLVRSEKSSDILTGIRVIDLTRMLSGPYATRILGDFGAEVIKVQSKKTARGAEQNGTPYFSAWNRNKRSICLQMDHPEAKEVLLNLVAISDVVVENFSPRVMRNWGLTYGRLKKANSRLIMASISAMGQTGPWRNYTGFAPTFHALSGLIAVASRDSDTPVDIANSYGDIVAGLYAALAILSALHHRNRTGLGHYIDLSAYEALCTFLGPVTAGRKAGREISACLDRRENSPADFFGCYPCSGDDRWCVISITGENEWKTFSRICKGPELGAAKFSTPAFRNRHRNELDAIIAQWTNRHRVETVVGRLQIAGITAGVVQNAADLAKDSHLAARRFFINLGGDSSAKYFAERSALWPWSEKPDNWKAAPSLGRDNRYVYRNLLGYSEAGYQALIKKGVIG